MTNPVIVWFRQDLRLKDNPALWYAAKEKAPIIPLYIYDEKYTEKWEMGAAQKVWLHNSLESLKKDLQELGLQLIIKKGNPVEIIEKLKKETKAKELYFNHCYEPFAQKRDQAFKNAKSFHGSLLIPPDEIKTNQNEFYKVFTPFYKTFLKVYEHQKPLGLPKLIPYSKKIKNDLLDLLPKHPDWSLDIVNFWEFGEKAADKRLQKFKKENATEYDKKRDIPYLDATSRLSPYLHMGEISARKIWDSLIDIKKIEPFLRQLIWREFCNHILYHVHTLPDTSYNRKFQKFLWSKSKKNLELWKRGQTGIPIIDAGMRQLWKTGWMHNRLRMIVASFLTKNLKIHWIEGAKWFWDTLVDADLANNSFGWQWVAGCGFDTAPYFRIFNPVTQGEKFDPDGAFVKQWVPELQNAPKKWIHKPWEATESELNEARINYIKPICDLKSTRNEALEAYNKIK